MYMYSIKELGISCRDSPYQILYFVALNHALSAQQSKSNEMLSGLRYFEHALKDNGRGHPKVAFSWGAVDMVSVAHCFIELCTKAVDVFSSEPRLLEVTSPTYVLGETQLCLYQVKM